MELSEAQKFLSDNDVKFVLAQFVDIHGVAKTKAVPAGHLEDIVTDGAGFAGFAVWGLAQEPHSPDFMAKADLRLRRAVGSRIGRNVCSCSSLWAAN